MQILDRKKSTSAQQPWGELPPKMHALFITSEQRTGSWLAEAFASDSASKVCLDEAQGMAAGVERLRDEQFDAVLIAHEPGQLDALLLLDVVRTSANARQPIVVIGSASESEMTPLCFEAGADAYVCLDTATTRTLIWLVARAIERHRLIDENERFHLERNNRLQQEQDETSRLLDQQRALVDLHHKPVHPVDKTSESLSMAMPPSLSKLPEGMLKRYRELIRAHVIMGTGNLGSELHALGRRLSEAGVATHTAMALHVYVVEELVHSLGRRSARHVMNRADLFILEVIMHMAEGYRRETALEIHNVST